jgi:hypothetical protein
MLPQIRAHCSPPVTPAVGPQGRTGVGASPGRLARGRDAFAKEPPPILWMRKFAQKAHTCSYPTEGGSRLSVKYW